MKLRIFFQRLTSWKFAVKLNLINVKGLKLAKSPDPAAEYQSERLSDELETLIDIGKALTSHLTLEDVYRVAMEKVSKLLRPKAWSLLIADEKCAELEFVIGVSPGRHELQNLRIPLGEGIAGWVAVSGEPLLVPDVRQEKRFSNKLDEQIGFQTRSIVCVPLKTPNRTHGVIQLLNSFEEGQFDGKDLRILSTIAEFTAIAIENSLLLETVRQLTITDDLTGLHNSRHFQQLCEYELERANRYQSQLSLVFLDLDRFKQVNDTYGHLTGSRLLKEFAELIQENIRVVDYAARYGGDEFVFLLPSTGKQGALSMAINLLQALREKRFYSDCGELIRITASLGVATYPDNAKDLRQLVQLADEAMYQVKRTTRNAIKTA